MSKTNYTVAMNGEVLNETNSKRAAMGAADDARHIAFDVGDEVSVFEGERTIAKYVLTDDHGYVRLW